MVAATTRRFGLLLGVASHGFHPMVIAAFHESFGASINHVARYKKLSTPEEILHETVGDVWTNQFRWTLGMDPELAVLVEQPHTISHDCKIAKGCESDRLVY